MKRNQEEFFDESLQLREKCNDQRLTKKCNKKKEKFVEKKSRKKEEKWSCGKDKWISKVTTPEMEKIAVIITKNLSTKDQNQRKERQ